MQREENMVLEQIKQIFLSVKIMQFDSGPLRIKF